MAESTTPCPGRYCGYPEDVDNPGTWLLDQCGACPRGYRTNATKYCTKCDDSASVDDWLYLGFMTLLPCTLHWIYMLKYKAERELLIAQLAMALLECVAGAMLAIISIEPKGRLELVSCGSNGLSDWYTMFYNPQIRYTKTIHCTQEAVYPLMSGVCIYYAYTLLLMLLFRPLILSFKWSSKHWKDPVYAALYFHPILVVVDGFFGGLIYYSYPYLTVIISVVALAAYFVSTEVIDFNSLRASLLRNIMITLWHFILLAYGIIAITDLNFYFVFAVPVPLLFYFLTVKFTDPENIDKEWHHY